MIQLLDRQQAEDDQRVMQAITWLGENGLLDEPTVKEEQGQVKTEDSAALDN